MAMKHNAFSPGDLVKPNPTAFFGCFHFLDLNCVGRRVDGYVSRTFPLDSLFLVVDCFFVSNPDFGPETFLAVKILCPDGRISIIVPSPLSFSKAST